ncbi:MAG: HEAT repeat domain-containing protein [Candidatus Abyssobacteria bacterium SURF_5]|uniref:HEAT repeat domain-containing protein n=1 Tax=Abyssobacteria bacterium (strain SURF_5) TaxID=2093360 RepID=A0A3A4NL94_ABYX5|nr:MAG: HEAT repeat domain-containing protein [Candidatus Abyssubacteria bacterium SURF_5]
MQWQAGPFDGSKTSTQHAADEFLAAFILAKKNLQLYPAGNAMVNESLQKVLSIMKKRFPDEEVVELLIEKKRIRVNRKEGTTNDPRVQDLALECFKRGVRKIFLDSFIPVEELRALLGILNLPRESIAKAGGIEKFTKSRNLVHALVEETAELMIVDGESFFLPDELAPQGTDSPPDSREPDSAELIGSMFVRIQGGSAQDMKRLQMLLKEPSRFSRALERFALQFDQAEGDAADDSQIARLRQALKAIETASTHLSSEEERHEVVQNLALSVLNMSAGMRGDLVRDGLVPNLALKSIESEILSLFPASQLADALLENFEASGGSASVLQGYFKNLKLSGANKAELAGILRDGLSTKGKLTSETEEVLFAEERSLPEAAGGPDAGAPPHMLVMEQYPCEKVLFLPEERSRLDVQVAEELQAPIEYQLTPILLELMRYENVATHHAAILKRVRESMEYLIEKHDFERAAQLLKNLKEEFERKKRMFSQQQLKPFVSLLEEYSEGAVVRELAATLRNMQGEGPEFERVVQYFEAAGPPAVSQLMGTLEEEKSRRARLLICKVIARAGDKNVVAVAEKLKHPKWFVVRNAVSILAQTGSPACVPYLEFALAHKDSRVRKEALRALAAIRSGEAVELLCSTLDDDDPAICKTALGWVAAIEAEQAVPILQRHLSGRAIFQRDDEFLRLSVDALKSIATKPALSILEKLAQTRSFFRRRKAAAIRALAGAALRDLSEANV